MYSDDKAGKMNNVILSLQVLLLFQKSIPRLLKMIIINDNAINI